MYAQIIEKYNRHNVNGIHLCKIKPMPMMYSKAPNILMEVCVGILLNVSQGIFLAVISSVSLKPEKNFINPNQKKIMPNDHLSIIIHFWHSSKQRFEWAG